MAEPLFRELQSGLARQEPGSREDTLRARALAGAEDRGGPRRTMSHGATCTAPLLTLEKNSRFNGSFTIATPRRILDIASGPGAASLALLEALPQARVTATYRHAPFLRKAKARVRAAAPAALFESVGADMMRLPFADAGFDLLWCEGAVYIPGLPAALAIWRPLLAPGGRLAFSDAVWLSAEPHPRARDFWREGYPAMADVAGVRARIAAAGWRAVGEFLLSRAAWEAYHDPLEARVEAQAARHGADAPVLAATAEEMAVWRAHGSDYGYGFFLASSA